MEEQPDFSDDFRNALESYKPAANLDRIETRAVSSDNHEGREYSLYGWYIPIRPIIDEVAAKEDFAIEHLSYIDESTDENNLEPHLNVFIADLRQNQSHPAFTQTP